MIRAIWVVEAKSFARPEWGSRRVSAHFTKARAEHVAKHENVKAKARYNKTGWECRVVRYVPDECPHHCRYCQAEFSVEDEILSLRDRVKELESKLGAASNGIDSDEAPYRAGSNTIPAAGQLAGKREADKAAAPSTYWSEQAGIIIAACDSPMRVGRFQIGVLPEKIDELVHLHRFAATITKWWEDTNHKRAIEDYLRLDEIITDFVVGEELPSTESAVDQEKPTC